MATAKNNIKKERIYISVTVNVYEYLKKKAAETGVSMSDHVNLILHEQIKKWDAEEK